MTNKIFRGFKNHTSSKERSKNTRGQIETFGLAFIVILISIGFFIYISIRANTKQENPQKEYTNDKLANDFVLSILDVSVQGCNGFSIKDLILDCARDRRISCNGIDSCTAANESISYLVNKTFYPMRTRLRMYSENLKDSNEKELINITYWNCTSTSAQGQAGYVTIPLYPNPGTVRLNMNICS